MKYEYHIPVLLSQSIEALKIIPSSVIVDVTYGAGGHSLPILDLLDAKGHLYAFDQDLDALKNAVDDPRFTLFHSNYRHIDLFLRLEGLQYVDGILADLGISSYQIDQPTRGFSFRFDAALDMRMNADSPVSALTVLHEYDEENLVRIMSEYGEVRNSKTLVKEILKSRAHRKIATTYDFNQILDRVKMGPQQKYFAQVYQALRIEVNDEMNGLIEFLEKGMKLLKPGGRFAIISYHSLEDRLVKNLFKTGNVEGHMIKDAYGNIHRPFKIINKNVIIADNEEQRLNPRSKSGKLRIAEKI